MYNPFRANNSTQPIKNIQLFELVYINNPKYLCKSKYSTISPKIVSFLIFISQPLNIKKNNKQTKHPVKKKSTITLILNVKLGLVNTKNGQTHQRVRLCGIPTSGHLCCHVYSYHRSSSHIPSFTFVLSPTSLLFSFTSL